ncbi:hypothetical protein KA005_17650, partial [bacterium]|nr:hypothetical protein [bacterium]
VVSGDTDFPGNAIVVGASTRNEVTSALLEQGRIKLEGVDNEQGYEIKTIKTDGDRTIIVAGGSVIGDVYGLYWIWDRMRVFKGIPDIDVKRVPELKIRFVGGNSKEAMKNALRNCATWVSGGSTVNLVPWKSEPEKTENEKNRERTRELIKYAHSLHMKYFTVGDEFAYHPSLLKEFGATLSPSDPAFWDAVQAKYRRLLQAMPELDGVRIRTGELTRVGGNYKAFNVMYDGEGCDWSLEKRYRTFVKKVYNVVVGEFDKIYFHRTWVTNDYEQHSKAQVYEKIFTEDVPVKNLYLSPYVNANDRWFFTAYNPTFNVTAHNMVILLSPMNYHASSGGKVFPTFPGQYFQAA